MTSKLKVLILDDSEIVLEMTALGLTEAGFEVRTASSLADFKREFPAFRPDIVLTDVQMPETSGDRICHVLKQAAQTKQIPIVLFSTIDEGELKRLAERAGADGYVSKNRGVTEIISRIQALTDEVLF